MFDQQIAQRDAEKPENIPQWMRYRWSTGQAAMLACALEASAPKAGNVHPSAAFTDMRFVDFLASSSAIARVFDDAASSSVGELVHSGVQATRSAVGLNTNLGSLLLLAPLARAVERLQASVDRKSSELGQKPELAEFRREVAEVLKCLAPDDSTHVYQAIRLASPAGLGSQSRYDVYKAAPTHLSTAMAQVASVDAVARQYVNDFADLFDRVVPWLVEGLQSGQDILESICRAQTRLLAHEPDGLIVRKAGMSVGQEVQCLAQSAIDSLARFEWQQPDAESTSINPATGNKPKARLHWVHSITADQEFMLLDSFLRADGHRRNPGTTADLLAASLFIMLVCNWR